MNFEFVIELIDDQRKLLEDEIMHAIEYDSEAHSRFQQCMKAIKILQERELKKYVIKSEFIPNKFILDEVLDWPPNLPGKNDKIAGRVRMIYGLIFGDNELYKSMIGHTWPSGIIINEIEAKRMIIAALMYFVGNYPTLSREDFGEIRRNRIDLWQSVMDLIYE